MSPAVPVTLSLLALLLALAALALATVANRRWARRSRPDAASGERPAERTAVAGTVPGGPTREQLEEVAAGMELLRGQVEELTQGLQDVSRAAADREPVVDPTALRHVALVRYDAFADVGGRLSYSVAVLDDTRSGLVLTTLAGKADVRTYVRAISGGATDGTLTAEEQQAIEAAGRQA